MSSPVGSILGHECQVFYLNKLLGKGTFAHAYLFHGPAHVGKLTVAKLLASALHCSAKPQILEAVCNECDVCRRIDEGVYPEVWIVDPKHSLVSAKDKRRDIPIEDIRELKRLLSFAPVKDCWRVAIINEAERLSQEAANSFLKLLEEPGARTLFILITDSPELVPLTIRSRVQPVRFSLVPRKRLEAFLARPARVSSDGAREGIAAPLREELLLLSRGRPGLLLEFIRDEARLRKEQSQYRRVAQTIGGLPSTTIGGSSGSAIFDFVEALPDDEEDRQQVMEYAFGAMHSDVLSRVTRQESVQPQLALLKRFDEILTLMATTNANQRLALEVALLTAWRCMRAHY